MKRRQKFYSVLCAAMLLVSSTTVYAAEEVVYPPEKGSAAEEVATGQTDAAADSELETMFFSVNKKAVPAAASSGNRHINAPQCSLIVEITPGPQSSE